MTWLTRTRVSRTSAGLALVLVLAVFGNASAPTPGSSTIAVNGLRAYPVGWAEDRIFIEGTISNLGTEMDWLLGGSSVVADRLEINGTSGCGEGEAGRIVMSIWGIEPGRASRSREAADTSRWRRLARCQPPTPRCP